MVWKVPFDVPQNFGICLVSISFFLAHNFVCRHTLFSFSRLTSSYVAYHIKMSPTCMFCVLLRGSWVCMGVHALMPTQAILPTLQHIATINIRSIFDGLVLNPPNNLPPWRHFPTITAAVNSQLCIPPSTACQSYCPDYSRPPPPLPEHKRQEGRRCRGMAK